MSSLIVEDGSIVSGANTFVSAAFLTEYLTDRGYPVPDTPDKIKASLILSYDFMKVLPWCESHYAPFTVTDSIKIAQCELSKATHPDDPADDLEYEAFFGEYVPPNVKKIREKIDVIEDAIEFFENKVASNPDMAYDALKSNQLVYAMLSDLLCPAPQLSTMGIYVV